MLCYLSATVNVMSFSTFLALGMKLVKPTHIRIKLVERSMTRILELIEDVLTKVSDFIVPMGFIVLVMEGEKDWRIILWCLFLATMKTVVDMEKGSLTLHIGSSEVTLLMYRTLSNTQAWKVEENENVSMVHVVDGDFSKLSNESSAREKVVQMQWLNGKESLGKS